MPTHVPIIHREVCVALPRSGKDFSCDFAVVAKLLLSFLFAMLPASNAFAQKIEGGTTGTALNAEWQFHHELFQMLLEERGLKTAESLETAFASPRDSVIVVIGKLNRVHAASAKTFSAFMAGGGTVLVALESAASLEGIASFTLTSITSEDSATQYQDHSDCLRVSDLDRSHPLMKGMSEIIVNRTGWLVLPPSSSKTWKILATVPETCSPRRSRGLPLIAVSESSSANVGTMIVVADPSLFTNSMLWHGDNAILAIRISELLCRGEKRRLAFFADGQLLPSYRASPLLQDVQNTSPPATPPLPPLPAPPRNAVPPKPTLETALRLANSVIQNVEESNILNEAVINQPRPLNLRVYSWIVLVGLIAIMAVWLGLKLEHTAAVRPPSPKVRAMQSVHALLKEGTDQGEGYGEAAQALARDLCQEFAAGCPPSSDWWHCLDNPAMQPSLERMNASQRRDLESIIELAANSDAPHISSRRLRQIGMTIQSLRGLHRQVLLEATQATSGAL